MDHAKLLDVLTSLPVSRSILPRAVYYATSHPANHAICSFIDSSGYASGPIRRCLFIYHIIIPRVVCFATSRPANHAICSFIDANGYTSGPIRKCFIIDYIIKKLMTKNRLTWIQTIYY